MNQDSLSELFFRAAEKWPDRPAVNDGEIVCTYRELAGRAARLAQKIMQSPPSATGIEAFQCRRGIGAYTAVLGILAAGRAYLPLPLKWPEARLRSVITRAKPGLVIKDPDLGGSVNSQPVTMPGIAAGANAYLLFTSGSTGEPKGITITHGQVLSYLRAFNERILIKPEDRVSQVFDLGFDLSVHDMFTTWSAGACLVTISEQQMLFAAQAVNSLGITVWFSTPSVMTRAKAMNALVPMPALRESLFCGEAMPAEAAEAWRASASGSRIHNLYGPTEATVAIAAFTCERGAKLPRGENDFVPFGTVFAPNDQRISAEGQLELCGPQVIRGYFGGGSTDKFACEGAKVWYRTGDRVKIGPNGFEFLGRADDQIKLRGFRVELNEINRVLSKVAGHRVASLAWPAAPSPAEMIFSFVEKSMLSEQEKIALIEACRTHLPEYMVPYDILPLAPFPVNANGKLDRPVLMKMIVEDLS